MSGPAGYRRMLEAYLKKKVHRPDDPNVQRWLWQTPEYEKHHTDRVIAYCGQFFPSLNGLKILDLGCGGGLDAANLARRGADVTAFEINTELLAIAAERFKEEGAAVRCEFDFDRLLRETASFDAVMMIDVLEHVSRPAEILQKTVSLLRPGGILILQTPNRWALGNIRRDPHWKLFGVSLMPRFLAAWYVCRFRKIVKEYDMEEFRSRGDVLRYLEGTPCRAVTGTYEECLRKMREPGEIRRGAVRKIYDLFSFVLKSPVISNGAARLYTLFFQRGCWVVARKA